MNKIKSILNIYFIVRDIGKPIDPIFSIGFMRQTGPPWKSGKGIQLRLGKYVTQIGICRSNKKIKKEVDGLLYAVQGRMMEETPKEIGSW